MLTAKEEDALVELNTTGDYPTRSKTRRLAQAKLVDKGLAEFYMTQDWRGDPVEMCRTTAAGSEVYDKMCPEY